MRSRLLAIFVKSIGIRFTILSVLVFQFILYSSVQTRGLSRVKSTAAVFKGQLFLPISGNRAYAIHFDDNGSLYFVTGDAIGNGRFSKVTPDKTVTHITQLSGSFIGPGLDMDKEGNFYIPLGDHVVKITQAGVITNLFTSSSKGISRALDLVLDPQNNIYIADDIQDKVFKIDTLLNSTVFIDNQLGKQQDFSLSDIYFDPDYKNLYLAEGGRNRLLKYPILENGQPGEVEIIFDNSKIGQIFNLALSRESTIVTVPVPGTSLAIITKDDTTINSLTNASHVIAARFGGKGFDSLSVYLTASTGIIQVDLRQDATSGASSSYEELPSKYCLSQNYPNPFNPTTTIEYSLPELANVKLQIFDLLGREVAVLVNGEKQAGNYSVTWSASKLTSGIYFYRLHAGSYTENKKLVILK